MVVDFLIVGGGPAGSTCGAILAQSGARVAIVERTNFESVRMGETLAPRVKSSLEKLGIEHLDSCVRDYGLVSLWGDTRPRRNFPSLFNAYGPGLRVDRAAFDRQVFECAGRHGAMLFPGAIATSAVRRSRLWVVRVVQGAHEIKIEAPFVVEATGRSQSSVCAAGRERIRVDKLVGLACLPERIGPESTAEELRVTTVESVPSGWWYSTVLLDERFLLVLFTDSDLIPPGVAARSNLLAKALDAAPWTRHRCRVARINPSDAKRRLFDARTSIRRLPSADGWMAIGDALMSIDPLSGIGVLEAIEGGIAAADLLLKPNFDDLESARSYAMESAARFNSLLRVRAKVYSIERRWQESLFWARRIHCGLVPRPFIGALLFDGAMSRNRLVRPAATATTLLHLL